MKRRILFATLFAVVTLLVSSNAVLADLNFGHRIYTTDTCGGAQKDPVHLMFYDAGTLNNTLSEFNTHVAWSYDGGSDMYFIDHGSCTVRDEQKGSDEHGTWGRYHCRFEYIEYYSTDGWNYYTIAAAHQDECWPYIGTNYDYARDLIADAFDNGGHYVWDYSWDSPGSIWVVCLYEGWYENFDGYWKFIEL